MKLVGRIFFLLFLSLHFSLNALGQTTPETKAPPADELKIRALFKEIHLISGGSDFQWMAPPTWAPAVLEKFNLKEVGISIFRRMQQRDPSLLVQKHLPNLLFLYVISDYGIEMGLGSAYALQTHTVSLWIAKLDPVCFTLLFVYRKYPSFQSGVTWTRSTATNGIKIVAGTVPFQETMQFLKKIFARSLNGTGSDNFDFRIEQVESGFVISVFEKNKQESLAEISLDANNDVNSAQLRKDLIADKVLWKTFLNALDWNLRNALAQSARKAKWYRTNFQETEDSIAFDFVAGTVRWKNAPRMQKSSVQCFKIAG